MNLNDPQIVATGKRVNSTFVSRAATSSLVALLALAASASVRADGGTFLSASTILSSGDTAQKIDLVFLGDGFLASEQGQFNTAVDQSLNEFLDTHPFLALRSAFNIHRVNVASPESGIDVYATCGGNATGQTQQLRRTAMDTGYCSGGGGDVNRCVLSSNPTLVWGFAEGAPDADLLIVLVNDGGHGGCRTGDLTFSTIKGGFEETVVHELGHGLADLADEYDYDRDARYTGGEPSQANVTTDTSRSLLKWRDLVLSSTTLPTQQQANCDNPSHPPSPVAADIVGLFEGAMYRRCDIYRPQFTCYMKRSGDPFCAVCQRKIIQDIAPSLGNDLSVTLENLLIRDDHDPWPRGDGEIYLHYAVQANAERLSGRWPVSGESDFDDGDSKNINRFVGTVPQPAPTTSGSIESKVREYDWPDSDDTLQSDATEHFWGAGTVTIDRADYRLRTRFGVAELKVLFNSLHIKDDHDGAFAGAGDIYVNYTISNGAQVVSGRWPADGTRSMSDGDTREMAILAASMSLPSGGNSLTIRVRVMDDDDWFTGGDDLIGDDTFSFGSATGYGANLVVHERDRPDYRISFSVAKAGP